MKPVYQRIISNVNGDCFAACIASILELDLDIVPNFVQIALDNNGGPEQCAANWLRARGINLLRFSLFDEHDIDKIGWVSAAGLYCIASVPSQKFPGDYHAIVCQHSDKEGGYELKPVHDPNPDNKPYTEELFKPVALRYLVNTVPQIK